MFTLVPLVFQDFPTPAPAMAMPALRVASPGNPLPAQPSTSSTTLSRPSVEMLPVARLRKFRPRTITSISKSKFSASARLNMTLHGWLGIKHLPEFLERDNKVYLKEKVSIYLSIYLLHFPDNVLSLFRPDLTVMIDWALKINFLWSIYLSFPSAPDGMYVLQLMSSYMSS